MIVTILVSPRTEESVFVKVTKTLGVGIVFQQTWIDYTQKAVDFAEWDIEANSCEGYIAPTNIFDPYGPYEDYRMTNDENQRALEIAIKARAQAERQLQSYYRDLVTMN